ncbi:inhibitor-1 of protein phosphatase type 2A [Perkinsela sp. CCAP 1560/4]|nr:inhibitor-1 of protein phosphatase type 2A [Perkinsela sp. CCAP 1560/4]|eukprot:KNH01769.1 inhibitor-1 of protein phosphatase type 2A [Perkinsela sp. CCAP 1560/4]
MSEPILREYTERQIENQTKNQPADEVKSISIGGSFFTGLAAVSQFPNLERLEVVAMNPRMKTNDLQCDPIVHFKELTHLNLSDNVIESLPQCFSKMFPALCRLELSSNVIGKDMCPKEGDEEQSILAVIEPLTLCTELAVLDLESNPICKFRGYREIVFRLIPSLLILDNKNKTGQEMVSDDSSFESFEFSQETSSGFMEEDEELSTSENDDGPLDEAGKDEINTPIKKMRLEK